METQRLHRTASHSSQKKRVCKGWKLYDDDGRFGGGGWGDDERQAQWYKIDGGMEVRLVASTFGK